MRIIQYILLFKKLIAVIFVISLIVLHTRPWESQREADLRLLRTAFENTICVHKAMGICLCVDKRGVLLGISHCSIIGLLRDKEGNTLSIPIYEEEDLY